MALFSKYYCCLIIEKVCTEVENPEGYEVTAWEGRDIGDMVVA
jgi:hypothetical protein